MASFDEELSSKRQFRVGKRRVSDERRRRLSAGLEVRDRDLGTERALNVQAGARLIRDNIRLLAGHALIYLQGLILTPIIIKTAGPGVYGAYVLVMLCVGFVFGVSSLGVGYRAKRFLPASYGHAHRRALFYPQAIFQLSVLLVLFSIFLVSYESMRDALLQRGVLVSPYLIGGYLLCYLLYSQSADYFRFTHRSAHFNYATVAQPYLHIALALSAFWTLGQLNVDILLATQMLACAAVAVPLAAQLVREIGFSASRPNRGDLYSDLRLGFPLVLAYTVDVVLSSADRVIIATLLSVSDVGYYAPAATLGSLAVFMAKVSGVVLPPALSRLVDEKREAEGRKLVDKTLKAYLVVSVPFAVGGAIIGEPLLALFTTAAIARAAWPVISLVAAGIVFYGLTIILSNVLFVGMKTRAIFHANVIAAALNLLLNGVLVYVFRDILVAAISTLVSHLAAFLFVRRTVVADWEVNVPLKLIARVLFASAVMGCVVALTARSLDAPGNEILVLGTGIAAGIVSYAGLVHAMRIVTPEELSSLREALRR